MVFLEIAGVLFLLGVAVTVFSELARPRGVIGKIGCVMGQTVLLLATISAAIGLMVSVIR